MHAGLCDSCAFQRVVVSGKGSRFSMCLRAAEEQHMPRYPRLPVLRCEGYESSRPAGVSGESGESA